MTEQCLLAGRTQRWLGRLVRDLLDSKADPNPSSSEDNDFVGRWELRQNIT